MARSPFKQKRRIYHTCQAMREELQPGFRHRAVMITLTYARVEDWRPNHLRDYVRKLQQWYRGRTNGQKMRVVWCLELQKRGAVHYHLMIWHRRGLKIPYADVGLYSPWWKHGTSNMVHEVRHEGAYMAKYIGKDAPNPPRGARTFGFTRIKGASRAARWASAPGYVRAMIPRGDDIRRIPRLDIPAGYVCRVHPDVGTESWNRCWGRIFFKHSLRHTETGYWHGGQSGIYLLPMHRDRYHRYCAFGMRHFFGLFGCNLAWTDVTEKTASFLLANIPPDQLL